MGETKYIFLRFCKAVLEVTFIRSELGKCLPRRGCDEGFWWICGYFSQLVTARHLLNTLPCLRTPVPCGPHCSRERSAVEARNSPQSPLSLGFSHSLGLHHARESLHSAGAQSLVGDPAPCVVATCWQRGEAACSPGASDSGMRHLSCYVATQPNSLDISGDSVSYWISFAIKFPFHLN